MGKANEISALDASRGGMSRAYRTLQIGQFLETRFTRDVQLDAGATTRFAERVEGIGYTLRE